MSQPSDASRIDYSSRGTKRFDVWGTSQDFFSYTQLARNFDVLDGIIGRPNDNAQWPPSIGVGGGIWAELQRVEADLDNRGKGIGDIWYWFRPSNAVPLTYITDRGGRLCDGSLVLAADHDFPNFNDDFYLPNLLNRFIVGADVGRPAGTPGTVNAAPGELRTGPGGNTGQSGAHQSAHSHSVDNHVHSVDPHAHPVSQHNHVVPNHRHGLPQFTESPLVNQQQKEIRQGSGSIKFVNTVVQQHNLASTRTQGVAIVRDVDNSGDFVTDLGGPTSTGAAGGGTTTANGAQTTSSTDLDRRPLHVGLLPVMQIRNP